MANQPIRTLRDVNGKPLLDEKGFKTHNIDLHFGFNSTAKSPTRKQRRSFLQKSMRNPFYGIHLGSRYIQVVRDKKNDMPKIIDHYPYRKEI